VTAVSEAPVESFLDAILHAWSHRVEGYAIGRRIDAYFAVAAPKAAIASRRRPPE